VRLIDADALEKFLKRLRRELPKESRDFFTRDEMILNFQQYVHMQPTIDAEPVVRGRIESNKEVAHISTKIVPTQTIATGQAQVKTFTEIIQEKGTEVKCLIT
jgi:hypothetical protein